ncbi:MAG: hypothetical protein ABW184_03030 [Sphingobium sp.]
MRALEPLALSRPAGEDDRRYVRHVCGYGCVRCASTIFQYRTLSGSDDVDDIILICPPCAHALTGKEGAERALRTMRERPLARQKLFDRRKLPYSNLLPDVTVVPGVTMHNVPVPILFSGMPVLRVGPPETPGGSVEISVALGAAGNVESEPQQIIATNEWMPKGDDGDWTFERPGNNYVITSRDRSAQLIIAIVTPSHLAIELLRSHGRGKMLESGQLGTRLDGVARPTPPARSQLVGMAI